MLSASPLPPGPPEPALVQAIRFGQDPYAFLKACARRYGDVFTLRLPGDPPRIVTSDPSHIRQIFALRADEYIAREQSFPLNVGESSLLFLDGAQHQRDRQLMMPHLHGERLRGYANLMKETADEVIDRWTEGQTVAIQPALQEVTLNVVLRCIFGLTDRALAERIRAPLVAWMDEVLKPSMFFSSVLIGQTRFRRLLDSMAHRFTRRGARRSRFIPWSHASAAKAEVIVFLRDEIARCRSEGTHGRTDVLALLANSHYEDGALMEVDHTVDELVTLLVGGHETTSNTLAWALCHILPRPDVLAAIEAERARVFGDGPIDPTRTAELPYLDAAIKESMRLSPIAPSVTRILTRPLTLGALTVPASAMVWPCIYLAHHREDLWPDPERYRPERFLDGAPSQSHFFPFGGGRRTCLGMAFANVEMRIVIAEILARTRLRLAPGARVQAEFRGITIAPSDGLRVIIDELRRPPQRAAA